MMLLTLTVLAVLSHTGQAGPASRLRGVDASFECAKTNHPDDCQFVGDLLNELKSQCGKGQRLVTDLRADTDFCDYGRTVSCTPDKTRLAQVQILMDPSANRWNQGTFCATKDQNGYYNQEALPNGDKNFQLPKSYSKLTNLTSLHLDGVTNICDVQDAVVLPTLTTVYVRAQNANVQTKCPGGNMHFPKIPNRTVHPLASIGFANINFAGEPLPSSLGTFVRRFECTNCSLSGSLPRGIMSTMGCPYVTHPDTPKNFGYQDFGCDSETNVCSPEVCAERDFSDDPVDYGEENLDFGVYLTGNDFNDVLTYDDVVRCSSGMPGDDVVKRWSQQINCLFEGSKLSFPREQATFHGPKKLPAYEDFPYPLLLSSFGIVGDLPSWLFESYQWSMIDLSFNDLVGTIPASIMKQSSVKVVQLHGNRLSGSLPDLAMLPGLRSRVVPQNDIGASTFYTYDVTLHANRFNGVRLPVGLFTLCNWAGDMAPFLTCGLRVDYDLMDHPRGIERPTNKFALPSPDKKACDRFGPGVDVLRLLPMGLSGHVSELLALANACYPDLVELVANKPVDDSWDHFGSSCDYRDESNSCTRNELLHGTLPSPLSLPKKLRKLSLVGTHITGKLPAASNIAQLDYFNVDNTTIDGPIPKDWAGYVAKRFVQPLVQCNSSACAASFVDTSLPSASGLGGWWVPLSMPHTIDPSLFLAYWKECHARVQWPGSDASYSARQLCSYFSVPFVAAPRYSENLGIVGTRLPEFKPALRIEPNPKITSLGGFGDVVAGKLPASFVRAAASAAPNVHTIDFTSMIADTTDSGDRFGCNKNLCGDVPDVLWSGFSKLAMVHLRGLRVSNAANSKQGPAQSAHLRTLTSYGVYRGEVPKSLIRACSSSNVECSMQGHDEDKEQKEFSSPCQGEGFTHSCNTTYTLPKDMSTLSDLKTLNLTGQFCLCDMNGPSLTRKLKQLPKLEILDLSDNPHLLLEREAVKSMHRLTTLRTSKPSYNFNFIGTYRGKPGVRFEHGVTLDMFLRQGLKGKNMTSLEVSSASVQVYDPVARRWHQTQLGFTYGTLSSEALAQFPNLKVLNIATTAVAMDVSQVLSTTCNMPHLEVLRLDGNELRGSIPPCLDGLRDLRVLNVGSSVLNTRTSISGKVPGMLGKRCVSTKSDHINCRFCPNAQLDWCQ